MNLDATAGVLALLCTARMSTDYAETVAKDDSDLAIRCSESIILESRMVVCGRSRGQQPQEALGLVLHEPTP